MSTLTIVLITLIICGGFFAITCGNTSSEYFYSWEPNGYGCFICVVATFIFFVLTCMKLGKWLL